MWQSRVLKVLGLEFKANNAVLGEVSTSKGNCWLLVLRVKLKTKNLCTPVTVAKGGCYGVTGRDSAEGAWQIPANTPFWKERASPWEGTSDSNTQKEQKSVRTVGRKDQK